MRRRGLAGGAAVHGGEHLGRPRLGPDAAAHLDQRAHDRPDHVVEEPVGLDFDGHEILPLPPAPLDPQGENRADACLARRAGGRYAAARSGCFGRFSGTEE